MSDPFAPITGGTISPFVTNLATINGATERLRELRNRGPGPAIGGPRPDPTDLNASTRVYVRNDTGTDLDTFAVLKLGDPIFDITSEEERLAFRKVPVFPGTAPAATTDQFAILAEPVGAARTDGFKFTVPAVVQGVTPCKIQVSDSGHGYATPSGSYTDRLASAANGPARILWKESGTGTKWAVVNLDGQQSAGSIGVDTDTFTSTFDITSDDTWTDTGLEITTSSAGSYLAIGHLCMSGLATGITQMRARLLVNGSAVTIAWMNCGSTSANIEIVPLTWFASIGSGEVVKIQAWRSSGVTWTQSSIFSNLAGGTSHSFMQLVKLG